MCFACGTGQSQRIEGAERKEISRVARRPATL
jgi:hypothetical protein